MKRIISVAFLGVLLMGLLSACSTTQKATSSLRAATEQLLISEAISRSLSKQIDSPLPIPPGAIIKLDATGLTPDKDMAKGVVAAWLGVLGHSTQDGPENATHRVNIVIDSLGSEIGNTFVGIPPIHSTFIPLSLPELAFFKADMQSGYARFHLDVFEMPSGRYITSSAPFIADTYYNKYTVLFLISFDRTDLYMPPRVDMFPKWVE